MRELMNIIEMGIKPRTGEIPQVLWHGTDLMALLGIMTSNTINTSMDTAGRDNTQGVSMTYDLDTAWSFAGRSVQLWAHLYGSKVLSEKVINQLSGTVIEFDAVKLAEKYHIVPYQDDDASDDEKEERILTGRNSSINPVMPFIRCFYASDDDFRIIGQYLRNPRQHEYDTTDKLILALKSLATHPLRRTNYA